MRKDKKREGNTIHVVLPAGIGRAVIQPVSLTDVEMITQGLF
jgi:3-dehydroquinate synthetase